MGKLQTTFLLLFNNLNTETTAFHHHNLYNYKQTSLSLKNFEEMSASLTKISYVQNQQICKNYTSTYLLLAECEVRTASYGPSFFLPFMAQALRAWAMKTRKEKTRIHNLPYGPSKRG